METSQEKPTTPSPVIYVELKIQTVSLGKRMGMSLHHLYPSSWAGYLLITNQTTEETS